LREAAIDESNDETICIMEDPFSEHETSRWLAASAGALWPSTTVQVLQGDYQKALADPGADYFDLAFLFGWPSLKHPDWECTRLYDQEINAFLPRQIFNSEGPGASLKTLKRYSHLVPSDAMPGLSDLLLWESRRSGCQPAVKTVNNRRTFLSLVLTGRGIGFAPANSFHSLPPSIVRIPYEPRITIPFVVIHRKHEPARVVHRMLNLACRLTNTSEVQSAMASGSIKKQRQAQFPADRRPARVKGPRRRLMSEREAVIPTERSDMLQASI
jgi:DNA-binding transcriptional LysR family regulator